jgi:transcriptional regulator with XRE-family HTH domain
MTNKPSTNIGAQIRKARKAKGLTQSELAQQAGVTQATVQKLETGRSTNSRYLPQIWAGLGLPLEELNPAFKADGRASSTRDDDNSGSRTDAELVFKAILAITAAIRAFVETIRSDQDAKRCRWCDEAVPLPCARKDDAAKCLTFKAAWA